MFDVEKIMDDLKERLPRAMVILRQPTPEQKAEALENLKKLNAHYIREAGQHEFPKQRKKNEQQ